MMFEDVLDKRGRILESAQIVFSRKGYHQAKIEEIAVLADVGKGTVYEYFSSKLELFKEMFIRVMRNYTANVGELPEAQSTTAKEKIIWLFENHLRFIVEHRDFAVVTFGDMGGMDEELLKWMYEMRKEAIARLEALVQEGITAGEFREVDPEVMANFLGGMMRGIVIPIMMEGRGWDAEKLAREFSGILFSGICRQD
ncbi:MAG: TetR/AcrR family transcriptional regulator [Candidatus Saccharibacteria bacterium]